RGLAIAGVELVTTNRLNRYVTIDRLERQHDRLLAEQPDRSAVEDGRLQLDIDSGFDKAGDLAEIVLGDRSLVRRAVLPDPPTTPDPHAVPERVAIRVRSVVRHDMDVINRLLKSEPIEHLLRVRALSGDRYRLVVRGLGNDAVGRVEVAHTERPDKVEAHVSGNDILLRVPPDFENLSPTQRRAASRETLAELTERQRRLRWYEAG